MFNAKRLFCLLMAIVMVVGVLPVAAMADDAAEEEEFLAAGMADMEEAMEAAMEEFTETETAEEAQENETEEETDDAELPEEELEEEPEPEEEPFTVTTVDPDGRVLNGFYSEPNKSWFLFVTSDTDVTNLVLTYTGNITAASAGLLDTVAKTVTMPFTRNGGKVRLTDDAGNEYQITVLQSALPSMYIDLAEGLTLEILNGGSKEDKYPGNAVSITTADSVDELDANGVEIKGRGNSTWVGSPKKPYQIKFASKTSVLGMGKAKKWILLANAFDDTLMHNSLVFDTAEKLGFEFVPEYHFVDLWIDGDYVGCYTLGEKNEIGSTRLNLKDDLAVLMEQDNLTYNTEDVWFYEPYFDSYYCLKESVNEDDPSLAVETFQKKIHAFGKYLYETAPADVTLEALSEHIDVESFAKYYLLNEYVENLESFVTSFNWFTDGAEDVLHAGPVWDFDSSMNLRTGNTVTRYRADEYSILFKQLLACPAFAEFTQDVYNASKGIFAGMPAVADAMAAEIGLAADMNYIRWNVLGQDCGRPYTEKFALSFAQAVTNMKTWLTQRGKAFVPCKKEINIFVNDGVMEITYFGTPGLTGLRLAIWSVENGQDDLVWCYPTEGGNNTWTASVPLDQFLHAGVFNVHAYANRTLLYAYTTYVDAIPQPKLTTALTGKTLSMTLQHVSAYSNVSFAVWSEKDGQDDLVWYPGTADGKGTVTCTVDLTQHWNEGNCLIHIYGDVNKVSTYITGTIIKMADKPEVKPEEPKDEGTLIKEADGQFHYYLNGKPVADKYGYVEYDGGLFLVAHGVVATDKSGLAQDPDNRQNWYFLSNGQAQLQYTGLARYDGAWFYVVEGKLDTSFTGAVEYDGGLFLVAAGRILTEVDGLAQDPITRKWYFFASGQAQLQYTGLAKYNTRWFYVDKGVFDDTFTGVIIWHGTQFKVEKGVMVGPAEAGK